MASERGRIARRARYMYICISVLARRLMEYTIESCVLYMYV